MESSANLALPYIIAQQAQKHVTHNEAVRMLDALVQLSVASRSLTEPPVTPSEGERHIVAVGASGEWEGWDGGVASFADGAWSRLIPREGWLAWVADDARLLVRTDGAWSEPAIGGTLELDGLGIRTVPDAANRLAVKSDAVLLSHDDQTPGSGDMRVTVNRSGPSKDAAFVFEDDWSTRALFGLLADDDFRIKVSPDGDTFYDAVAIDAATGAVALGEPFLTADDDGVWSHRDNLPAADDTHSLGSATHRWSVVHAATGTISTSDERLKEAVAPVPVGIDFLRDLEAVCYRRKGGRRMHFGLLAQQVKAALQAHGVDDFAGWTLSDRNDPASRQGLRYEQFVPILVRAVQELASEVDTLRDTMAGPA
ncbi:DUF2793 domain-containing protein [Mesorhizobium sp. CAU 1741]|uniref:DUF2793 domain-containing protein n=1 Tax=Mesorhizobium sp. CAU 1741 TaxID=3140366 RepID=UPI00325B9110